MEVLIRGQKPCWGVVCSRSHSSPTLFVRFIEGQLMLTRRSRNWERDSSRDVKVGDVIQFIWKPYTDLDGCVGVVDTFLIVPPEKQPSFLTTSVRSSNGPSGPTVLVSCQLRYEGKDGEIATFFNEYLGRVYDDNKKIHEKALTTQGFYQCLISRYDDRNKHTHYWMIAQCQFFPQNLLDGPHHGFAVRLPDREDPLIWPTDSISKRPIPLHKEVLSGFRDSSLGCFVDYWVIPGSRTVGRMHLASCQPPTKKIGDKYLIALECTYTGHKTRVNNIDVLCSRMYRWIEDRPGFAKKLKMKKKDSQYFWCYLDTSSTNAAYLDWVVFEKYDEGMEGPFARNSPQASCYPKDIANGAIWSEPMNDFEPKSAYRDVVGLEEFDERKWFDGDVEKPQRSFYQDSGDACRPMVDKWIDSNVAWERTSKQTNKNEPVDYTRPNGLSKENRYELETRIETSNENFNVFGQNYTDYDNGINLQYQSPTSRVQDNRNQRGMASDEELIGNMKRLAATVRELFQDDEVREVARRVNAAAYGDLVETLAFNK